MCGRQSCLQDWLPHAASSTERTYPILSVLALKETSVTRLKESTA